MANSKYEVKVLEAYGTCDSDLFKKMATKGDITSDRVKNVVDKVFQITGYAKCNIITEDKNFDVVYYATNTGFISSGSEVLFDSIIDYIGDTDTFRIKEIKTKKGTTFKGVPIFKNIENEEVFE